MIAQSWKIESWFQETGLGSPGNFLFYLDSLAEQCLDLCTNCANI